MKLPLEDCFKNLLIFTKIYNSNGNQDSGSTVFTQGPFGSVLKTLNKKLYIYCTVVTKKMVFNCKGWGLGKDLPKLSKITNMSHELQ